MCSSVLCGMFMENMPYRGVSPVEAWEYWLDEPPSEVVCARLNRLLKDHITANIIEAIEITSNRMDITEEKRRLQYINGILQRKVLQTVAPERAEKERQIDVVELLWKKSNLGSWPLSRLKIAYWLQYCTVEEIKALMGVAYSWSDLRNEIDHIIEGRQQAANTGPEHS
jgi:hypothetical protein